MWANIVFESFLHDSTPTNLPRNIDGPRLCYLRRDVPKHTPVVDELFFFFKHLHQVSFSNRRGLNLSPYCDRAVGPDWFTCPRVAAIPSMEAELDEIWSNFLCCQAFFTSLPDSNNMNIELHNPSLSLNKLVSPKLFQRLIHLTQIFNYVVPHLGFFLILNIFWVKMETNGACTSLLILKIAPLQPLHWFHGGSITTNLSITKFQFAKKY